MRSGLLIQVFVSAQAGKDEEVWVRLFAKVGVSRGTGRRMF
jgi:hypothetical protein